MNTRKAGLENAEAQLLEMATKGVQSELNLMSDGKKLLRLKRGPNEGKEAPPSETKEPNRKVMQRFGIEQERVEEPLSRKISPSVRPSTWIGVRKLELRLEEMGDKTSLNLLTDSALRTMVSEMNAGLDGATTPDAYDLAWDAIELLKSIRKLGQWNSDMDKQMDHLLNRIDEL